MQKMEAAKIRQAPALFEGLGSRKGLSTWHPGRPRLDKEMSPLESKMDLNASICMSAPVVITARSRHASHCRKMSKSKFLSYAPARRIIAVLRRHEFPVRQDSNFLRGQVDPNLRGTGSPVAQHMQIVFGTLGQVQEGVVV